MDDTTTSGQPPLRLGRQCPTDASKRQAPKITPFIVGIVLFVMATVILFKSKASKGTCIYDNTYRRTTCKVKHLTSIPEDVPSSVLALHMGNKLDKAENSFTVLEPSNFTEYSQLQELHLVKCGIQEIKADTFAQLTSLRKLDLRYNRLQTVSESTFRGLTNLEYLYLSNNPITHLSDYTFRGIRIENLILANNPALSDITTKAFAGAILKTVVLNRCSLSDVHTEIFWHIGESLSELYLTNNLQALSLPDAIFKGLNLKVLNLDNNGLTEAEFLDDIVAEEISLDDNPLQEIDFDDSSKLLNTKRLSLSNTKLAHISQDDFEKLLNLEELDLEQNQITVLNASVFSNLKSLHILDMSGNDLEMMTGEFDASFPSLEALFLDDNDFETLPDSLEVLFSRLKNLTLHGNPLHCNCELKWLDDWIERHPNIIEELPLLRCATPDAMNFTQVPENGFQCRAPNILNATFDSDGVRLVCTAEGDPAPIVSWFGSRESDCKTTEPRPYDRDNLQTICTIAISREGNYTCTATNLAGNDSELIDTKKMPTSGLKFVSESQEIEILETPQGLFITAVLLVILGYIFRVS